MPATYHLDSLVLCICTMRCLLAETVILSKGGGHTEKNGRVGGWNLCMLDDVCRWLFTVLFFQGAVAIRASMCHVCREVTQLMKLFFSSIFCSSLDGKCPHNTTIQNQNHHLWLLNSFTTVVTMHSGDHVHLYIPCILYPPPQDNRLYDRSVMPGCALTLVKHLVKQPFRFRRPCFYTGTLVRVLL